jgi:hypothetical protein
MIDVIIENFNDFMNHQKEINDKINEQIDFYENMYWKTKKRKDLRRCSKTRILKYAEQNWRIHKSILDDYRKIIGV